MHKIVVAFATVLTFLVGPVITASSANATEPWVTRTEYRKVVKGMRIARVHRIFDTNGTQYFHMSGYQSREYRTRSEYGFVYVDYRRRNGFWVVTSKSAYWG